MRLITSLLLCATAALGVAQDPSMQIDYTTRAVPLRKVLVDLSKLSGKHLVCSPELDEEPLILRLNHVSVKEAMDKIAQVFAGEWVEQGKGINLVRGKQAQRMHEEELALRAKAFSKELDAALEAAANSPDAMPPEQLVKTLGTEAGMNKLMRGHHTRVQALLAAICKKLDPLVVAGLMEGQRIVFASDPNVLQRPLPDISGELDRYLADCEAEARAIEESSLDQVAKQGALNLIGDVRPPASVIFSLTKVRQDYTCALDLYDADGVRRGSPMTAIGPRLNYRDHWNDEQKLRAATPEGVGFSPDTLEIWTHARPTDESVRPLSPRVRQMLLTPTQYEPLSFACSDMVLGLAERSNLNAICLPSELGEGWGYLTLRTKKGTMELLQKVLNRARDTQAIVEDGWLTMRPYDPLDTTSARLSRKTMEQFVKAVAQKKAILFDDKARLALGAGPTTDMTLASNNASALAGTEDFYIGDLSAWSITAFWATLSDSQRKAAQEGTLRLAPADLDRRQTDVVSSWVLNQMRPMEYVAPVKSGPPPPPTLAAERTMALADGLPADSSLEISESAYPLFDVPIQGMDAAPNFGVESLAELVAQNERPDLLQHAQRHEFSAITRVERHGIRIRLTLPSGYGCDYRVDEVSGKGKPQALVDIVAGLSAAEREQYDRALAKARRDISKVPVQPMNLG